MSFPAFNKIPRLYRDVVVTEKIDGTNGLVFIEARPPQDGPSMRGLELGRFPVDNDDYYIYAGSRKRWVTPDDDNFGFAAWVKANGPALRHLGAGHHYGEWWGSGINRGYGLTKGERKFSLFNTSRWLDADLPACVGVVPVLGRGNGDYLNALVDQAMMDLRNYGSIAKPGFMNPEGVVVYHEAGNNLYKVTLENDAQRKSLADQVEAWLSLEPLHVVVEHEPIGLAHFGTELVAA